MRDHDPRADDEADAEPRCSVRLGAREIEVGGAWIVIGRDPDCDLVLDDTFVSRRHARIAVTDEGVVIEDLSTNGVFVDGLRVDQRIVLTGDAVLTIGTHQIEICQASSDRATLLPTLPQPLEPPESFDALKARPFSPDEDPGQSGARPAVRATTARTDAIALLGSVAEQLLASGRVDAAERLMAPRLIGILEHARAAGRIDPALSTGAARMAVQLAAATSKPSWIEYAFELSTVTVNPLPLELVDELYTLVRRLPAFRLSLLSDYVTALSDAADRLTPNERFVVQRLKGLAKLALALGSG